MLLSFEFATSFGFKFRASRIYYGTQSDFRVKCYCCSNLLRASVLNFERLNILRDSIGLPSEMLLSFEFASSFVLNFERLDIFRDSIGLSSEKLLSFEFATSFGFKFRVSRIYYGTQSDFRVKCYCRSNLLVASF